MRTYIATLLLTLGALLARAQNHSAPIVLSEELEIIALTPHVLMHVSKEDHPVYGKFTCNGLVYIHGGEAIIMDTPSNDTLSLQLLDWLYKNYPGLKIKGIIVNHFHVDCLGGLKAMHQRGIRSYSSRLTPALAARDSAEMPQITFGRKLDLNVGKSEVISCYFGEAHTRDNIVTWIPDEKVLFGGCMVKSMNAGKGNIADANLSAWSETVSRVKAEFPEAKIVIPGHGVQGGQELLDYTIRLFKPVPEK